MNNPVEAMRDAKGKLTPEALTLAMRPYNMMVDAAIVLSQTCTMAQGVWRTDTEIAPWKLVVPWHGWDDRNFTELPASPPQQQNVVTLATLALSDLWSGNFTLVPVFDTYQTLGVSYISGSYIRLAFGTRLEGTVRSRLLLEQLAKALSEPKAVVSMDLYQPASTLNPSHLIRFKWGGRDEPSGIVKVGLPDYEYWTLVQKADLVLTLHLLNNVTRRINSC